MDPVKYFHGDDVIPAAPEDALFHIIPVPYEKTVSYGGGTADGPRAILDASCQLELFDGKSNPALLGLYTSRPVSCAGEDKAVLKRITTEVGKTLALDKIPVVLGGEHTVTLGSIKALEQKYDIFGVVQFDAHADLRDSYQGTLLNHACVMKRIHDRSIPIFQLGVRSLSVEEHVLRKEQNILHMDAEEIFRSGVEGFSLPPDFPDKIFITFDIDALDPALMPATGTPVPGGLTWYQSMWLIEKIMQSRICIGFDVVELAPVQTFASPSYTAAQLVYNMMGYLSRSEVNKRFYGINDQASC
jgi:agmatinase